MTASRGSCAPIQTAAERAVTSFVGRAPTAPTTHLVSAMRVVGIRSATSRPSHAIRSPARLRGRQGIQGAPGDLRSIVICRPPPPVRCVIAKTSVRMARVTVPRETSVLTHETASQGWFATTRTATTTCSAGPFVVCLVTAAWTSRIPPWANRSAQRGLAPATRSASRMARQIRRLGFATTRGAPGDGHATNCRCVGACPFARARLLQPEYFTGRIRLRRWRRLPRQVSLRLGQPVLPGRR